jgi:hypothetical protein
VWRTRAYVNTESRQQTAYGTLRTYLNVGLSGNNSTDLNANRAFIQIAGFTVGKATSYFDHYSGAAVAYLVDLSSDSGDGGQEVFAYTAQLGNGVSASLSVENPATRRFQIYRDGDPVYTLAPYNNFTGKQAVTGFAITDRSAKIAMPNIVGNLRVDQAWGSAQIMGALKDTSGAYYPGGVNQNNGHPDNELGWAVGAGIKINMPMIAAGDFFAAQVAYSEGALKYICQHPGCSFDNHFEGGTSFGYGIWTDAVYGGGTDVQLTTGWGVVAAWEHFWTPALRTSLHGGYLEVRYNDLANDILCNGQGEIVVQQGECNNNFSRWQIGSRTQWNVTKAFYMGFDVLYQKINTASEGAIATVTGFGGQPTADRIIEDQDNWAVRARWHRDLP